jgi:hypothetical protein
MTGTATGTRERHSCCEIPLRPRNTRAETTAHRLDLRRRSRGVFAIQACSFPTQSSGVVAGGSTVIVSRVAGPMLANVALTRGIRPRLHPGLSVHAQSRMRSAPAGQN